MRWPRGIPLFVALTAAAACASASGGGESGAPVRLNIPRSALPGPGLCRVWISGRSLSRQPLTRGCEGIENTAPLGSRVLYRPGASSREVHVRYMSTSYAGVVSGIDAFNMDTLRLVRVIQPYQGRD